LKEKHRLKKERVREEIHQRHLGLKVPKKKLSHFQHRDKKRRALKRKNKKDKRRNGLGHQKERLLGRFKVPSKELVAQASPYV
jgi:hypothetical protein